MKQSVNSYDFIEAFRTMDRYDQFGHDGLKILFSYLEELEQDTGEEMELDVIALCCDYSVDSVSDIAANYSIDLSDCEDDDERNSAVLNYLEDNTQVCGTFEADGTMFVVYCSAF